MMKEFDDALKFIQVTHRLQQVKRRLFATGEDRPETDAEHGYQLGLLGWYLVIHNKLSLDPDKVLKYGLVHDMVEAYAGDTFAYEKDPTVLQGKVEREALAAEQLRSEFPDFTELHELIEGYKTHSDPESKFVYALDKVLPMMNVYLEQGRSWRHEGITLEMMLHFKPEKIALSPEVKKYYDHLMQILKEREAEFFNP